MKILMSPTCSMKCPTVSSAWRTNGFLFLYNIRSVQCLSAQKNENFERFRYAGFCTFSVSFSSVYYPCPCMNSSFFWNWCARKHMRVVFVLWGMVRVELLWCCFCPRRKLKWQLMCFDPQWFNVLDLVMLIKKKGVVIIKGDYVNPKLRL